MRIFNHDISLKKAAVYAAVAAKLFGRTNAPTMKAQNEKPEYKYIKEFAAFVVYLEDEGKTALFR